MSKKPERKPEEIRERNAMIRAMVCRILCVAVFVFALVLTWTTAWSVSTGLLDSDTSSELVLAEKLSREGGIISNTWIYSTEIEFINLQIIYSLLFHLTGDWSLVRFFGNVIMHCLMLGAYAYLGRQTRMRVNAWLLTAAAMILPFSVPYGRIVVYHNYYIVYVTLAMWMVGLYLSAMRKIRIWRDKRRLGEKTETRETLLMILPGALMALVAFGAGLGGMRMLLVSAGPIVVAALLWAMTGENGQDEPHPFRLPVALAVGMAVFCGLGYLVNAHVLAKIYTFQDFSVQTVRLVNVNQLEKIFRGLLASLGFQEELDLFTVHGLLSIGSALVVVIVLILGIHTLRHTRDPYARFIQLYMFAGLLVVTAVFVLVDREQWVYELYYLPLIVWILPALGKSEIDCPPENHRPKLSPAEKKERTEKKPARHGKLPEILFPHPSGAPTTMGRLLGVGDLPLNAHGLLALICCCIFIGNGVFHSAFFRDPASLASELSYTGLGYQDPFTVEALTPVAEYLKKEGYTLVYADYWEAAVITELTDGQVKSVPIVEGTRRKALDYEKWLVDTNLYNPENLRDKKACILAGVDLLASVQGEEKIMKSAVERDSFGSRTVVELTDPTVLAEYLD